MPRPFAVIGFTVFFTIALLYNSNTGAIIGAFFAFAAALVISIFITEARNQKVLPCAFASGLLACIILLVEINFYYLPAVEYDGKTCRITAQLADYPNYRYGNYYYDSKAVVIDGVETDLKLRLVFSSLPDAEPYDLVEGNFTFYVLGSSSEEYLASNKAKGVFVGAYPVSGEYSVNRIPEDEKPFKKTIVDLREKIKNAVHRAVPGDSGSLATALLIGDRSNLSSDILSDFRLSGMTHIICVSGFHLSLCAAFLLFLLKKLKIGDRIASAITVFAVILFMLIAGMTYSVMRSGIMMLLYLFSNIIRKKRDSLNSLGFSLAVIAIYNPFAMGSVGLQLSALSTLGLILYSQYIKPKINAFFRKNDNIFFGEVLLSIIDAVLIPVAATLFTLPVYMNIYNEFNFAVYASNVLGVPIATLCILFSAGAALFGLVFSGGVNFFGTAAEIFCTLLIKISKIFADFELLTFRADSDSSSVLVCGVLLFCSMAILMAYSGKKHYKLSCVLCAVVFTFGLMFISVSRESETRINVIDVGNGTSVLVSKNGENILVGCGGTEFLGAERINDVIEKTGCSLDCIIVPDAEFSSASYLNKILFQIRPDAVYSGSLPYGSGLLLDDSEIYDIYEALHTENFNMEFVSCGAADCVYIESTDMTALVCFDPVFDYSDLPSEFRNADVIITRNDYPDNIENLNCKLVILNSENSRGVMIQNELSELGIKCVATGGCGNILIRGENGFVSANRN